MLKKKNQLLRFENDTFMIYGLSFLFQNVLTDYVHSLGIGKPMCTHKLTDTQAECTHNTLTFFILAMNKKHNASVIAISYYVIT